MQERNKTIQTPLQVSLIEWLRIFSQSRRLISDFESSSQWGFCIRPEWRLSRKRVVVIDNQMPYQEGEICVMEVFRRINSSYSRTFPMFADETPKLETGGERISSCGQFIGRHSREETAALTGPPVPSLSDTLNKTDNNVVVLVSWSSRFERETHDHQCPLI